MDLSETQFTAHNTSSDFEKPEDISEYFSLSAPPTSTLWRKPTTGDDVSAPMILTRLTRSFMIAEVTIIADMRVEWDQAGLVIFVGMDPNEAASTAQRTRRNRNSHFAPEVQHGKWVKVGLGVSDEELGVATAVAQPNCGPDWSFTPVFPDMDTERLHRTSLRIKFEKVGKDLWVWYRIPQTYIVSNGRSPSEASREWKKARELSEFFMGVEVKSGIWVGCYASRPLEMDDGDGTSELFVEFEDLEIL